MNIALLTYSTQPRGSVIHTLELGNALTALGHTVCVFALDKDGRGFEHPVTCEVCLVPTQPAPTDIDALIQQRINEFVDGLMGASDGKTLTQPFDIYHAQDCIGANALLELHHRGLISHFVRTIHHVEDYQSPYLQQCQDKSIRQPDLRLCVSDRWHHILSQDYGIDAPRVINGVNLNRFSPQPSGTENALRDQYGIGPQGGGPVFLTVGGIEPRKNSIALLEAFSQVLETHPTAQLMIAGGATLFDYQPYRDRFFTLVDDLKIAIGTQLILPGVIPATDLPASYRCADVFCFPSIKEGWGLVVLEAIASGLPVVVSQQFPFTEFLADDQACWCDPAIPSTIAAAMLQGLAEERNLQIERSYAAIAHYSWERSAQMHLAQYEQLLQSSAQSPV